jgi:radical SAM protein with 4Fe4S-binding SPASM domain
MAGIFVKTTNALASGSSFLLSSLIGRPVISGMPVTISFELTNHCNLKCPECASGSGQMKRERGFMDIGLYEKVISEMRPYLYISNLYFQGEPLMHPGFFSFTRLSENLKTVVSTNGHFLTEDNSEKLVVSGVSKLIVSLDGMDQKAYSEYRRNGDLGKVIDGIRTVAEARNRHHSKMKLELQFLVSRHNEHQIADAELFAKEMKADLKLKSMQVINSQNAGEWMPSDKKFTRYKNTDGKYSIKNSMPARCLRLWLNPVITWDGKVIPCCFDKDAEFAMGDLNKESFRSIWNGRQYSEFRGEILTSRNKIEICRNCTSSMRGVRF